MLSINHSEMDGKEDFVGIGEEVSKVNNINPIERKIHIEFHCLAEKYDIDVDIIAAIIVDWEEWVERNFIDISRKENDE